MLLHHKGTVVSLLVVFNEGGAHRQILSQPSFLGKAPERCELSVKLGSLVSDGIKALLYEGHPPRGCCVLSYWLSLRLAPSQEQMLRGWDEGAVASPAQSVLS